ncbi:hypothetical protein FB45DRAFT_940889 [Roridomyces roridus]|uniref:Uncharacterized protein n=1 Tax=Roridomyces roridus TaxID=1738132 RepID=A0AAD7FD16_9AGAR|nr:hypothetical protein FB45DRAFT_940889 [Roridomyces roridus]
MPKQLFPFEPLQRAKCLTCNIPFIRHFISEKQKRLDALDYPLPPSDNTITLPHLRRLCIADDASVSDRIVVPLLEELRLEWSDWDETLLIPKVLAFVGRSSCNWNKLIVDGFPLDHIHDLARILPSLKYLIILSPCTLLNEFWNAMTFSNTQNHFLHLEFLACHWHKAHRIDSISAMMQSRNPPKPGHKTLSLRFIDSPEMVFTEEILEFTQDQTQFDVAFLSERETSDAVPSWNLYWSSGRLSVATDLVLHIYEWQSSSHGALRAYGIDSEGNPLTVQAQ